MTLRTQLAVLMALIAAAAIARAQVRDTPARPATGTSVITGTVVSGLTGDAPARRARVRLQSTDGSFEARSATTDDEGRFEFANLPAGRFTLDVTKPGYLSGSYGAAKPGRAGSAVSVSDGARVTGLKIRMVHGSAISGTVRDSRGRPVPGVSVSALRFTYSYLGERNVVPAGGTTDDRGVYRIYGLSAGEYMVAAVPSVVPGATIGVGFHRQTTEEIDRLLNTPRGINTGAEPASQPAAAESRSGWVPVFHPGATDFQSAATFVLGDDEERGGIDIAIAQVPASRISGVVRMPDGRPPTRLTIALAPATDAAPVMANAPFMRTNTASTDAEGRFAFEDVPSGRFKVTALLEIRPTPTPRAPGVAPPALPPSNPSLWATTYVDIQGEPISVQLDLQPSMTITGRLIFDGASPPPKNVADLTLRLNQAGRGFDITGTPAGPITSEHTFTINGLMPETYRLIELTQRGWDGPWRLKSAVAGGRDVFDMPLVLAPGEKLEMVLTYTDRPPELSGSFQDVSGRPAPDYFIVVFPVDQRLWTSPRRLVSTRPANDGQYSIKFLPAGDYFIAAMTDFQDADFYAPSFLSGLAAMAHRVTLTEGQVTRQDLKVGR